MIYDILPVNNYSGNSLTTRFDFNFYIENENQLKVSLFDEDNTKFELTNELDYHINELKNKEGSYITFPLPKSKYSILKENQKISLELILPISQETQYNNSSLLNPEALEYSFDYLTRLIQILSRKLALCVKVEECSDATPTELLASVNSSAKSAKEAMTNTQTILGSVNNLYNETNELYNTVSEIKKTIDLKYEQYNAETLSINKLNIDIDNITQTGKNNIVGLSMPNKKTISYSSSTSKITAPCHGWFQVLGTSAAVGAWISAHNSNTGITHQSYISTGVNLGLNCPILWANKDDVLSVGNYCSSIHTVRFYPSQGLNYTIQGD